MKVVEGLAALGPPPRNCVLTIGNFDGVHLAHRGLLALAKTVAAECGGPVIVLSFEPHPLTIVAPQRAPLPLTPLPEKLRRLEESGTDITVVATSEPSLLGLEAEEFIEQVVRRRFCPAHIVEGPSFGFGRGRRGTPELLSRNAAEFNCTVHIVDPVSVELNPGQSVLVSSSLIRRLILEGKVSEAAKCLGRNYALFGKVISGEGRGRTLGFPTANVDAMLQVVPADGVYAGRAVLGDDCYACAISIGNTPTFGVGARRIEAFLLNFDGNIYGAPMALEFVGFLRGQQTFASPHALIQQLERDVEAAHDLVAQSGSSDQKEARNRPKTAG